VPSAAYETPAVVDRLPPAYRDLFDRAAQVLVADERVRGMWLGGSLARGTADAASDLDVFVAVTDEHLPAFAEGWRDLLASITPTVLAEEQWFAKGSFWSITPGYERFDVVVEPVSKLPESLFPVRAVVFDHDGLTARLPDERPRSAAPATVGKLVEAWFHFSAMPEVILVREDWLLATEHLHLLRDFLYQLYVEANQPQPPMGLKRWTEKLTPEQARVLRAAPTSAEDRDALVAAHLELARAFLGTARPLAASLGVAWPDELEAAARAHLGEVFGVDDPYPA
jgi:predicted nucleotidyltransferase